MTSLFKQAFSLSFIGLITLSSPSWAQKIFLYSGNLYEAHDFTNPNQPTRMYFRRHSSFPHQLIEHSDSLTILDRAGAVKKVDFASGATQIWQTGYPVNTQTKIAVESASNPRYAIYWPTTGQIEVASSNQGAIRIFQTGGAPAQPRAKYPMAIASNGIGIAAFDTSITQKSILEFDLHSNYQRAVPMPNTVPAQMEPVEMVPGTLTNGMDYIAVKMMTRDPVTTILRSPAGVYIHFPGFAAGYYVNDPTNFPIESFQAWGDYLLIGHLDRISLMQVQTGTFTADWIPTQGLPDTMSEIALKGNFIWFNKDDSIMRVGPLGIDRVLQAGGVRKFSVLPSGPNHVFYETIVTGFTTDLIHFRCQDYLCTTRTQQTRYRPTLYSASTFIAF